MSLKDVIDADINSVFFNTDEFADYYNVENFGWIPIVQDHDRILEKTDISAFGTELGEGLIFVQVRHMPDKPLAGDSMFITDKTGKKADWYVGNIIENSGVYEIRLYRNKQGRLCR